MHPAAKVLIISGLSLLLLGLIVQVGGRFHFFGLGHLPGDIRVERDGFRFYFPITTCIVLSLVLSVLLYLFSRIR